MNEWLLLKDKMVYGFLITGQILNGIAGPFLAGVGDNAHTGPTLNLHVLE